ncbi:MAG: hypothetical protein ACRCSC_01880 [Lactococcus garvieae]
MGMGKQHTYDEQKAKFIAILASVGLGIKAIASIVQIADKTLTKYYSRELKEKTNLAHDHVKAKILQLALKGDTDMLKHFSKCQMGWKEKQEVEHKGIQQPIINIITKANGDK